MAPYEVYRYDRLLPADDVLHYGRRLDALLLLPQSARGLHGGFFRNYTAVFF